MDALEAAREMTRKNPEAGRALVDAVRTAIEAARKRRDASALSAGGEG